jgi:hypothetical protein
MARFVCIKISPSFLLYFQVCARLITISVTHYPAIFLRKSLVSGRTWVVQ